MKPFHVLLGVSILSSLPSSLRAAVAEGENLLINGGLDAEQVDFPEFWTVSSTRNVTYDRTGGPEGKKASIVLKSDDTTPGKVSVRQQGMTLVAGETYKLSASIKTKGLKCGQGGLVVHNAGWAGAVGFSELPADSDWTFMEKTFTSPPSTSNQYGLAMFAVDLTGEIHFADLKLEAISEGARKGSSSNVSMTAPRLIPYQPLLNKIPRSNPELILKFHGVLPEKQDGYECVVVTSGERIPQQTVPLEDSRILVRLGELPCGDYSVEAVLRHRETRETILTATYPISIVDLPVIDRGNIKPMNNLVAEVLNQAVEVNPTPQTFSFVNPRDGWVFVAISAAAPATDLIVKIDDQDTLITATTDRLEAFRELGMGEHRITVSGVDAPAHLVVRSIPEIVNYPPCTNSYVQENGLYDWAFMKRHILGAVTTFNGGSLPGEALAESKSLGLRWLANFCVAPLDDAADVQDRMEKTAGMTEPQYDGFTSDELFFSGGAIDNYTKALWRVRNPENRLIYTWIVGKPDIASLHTEFISACLNASRGRGRLLFEAYCHPQADEKAAAAYLDSMIGDTMRRFNKFFPNAAAGTGLVFGNFNQIPIITLEYEPAVDYKYYLDMQVHRIANSPDCKDLAATGYWGTYYGDEEMARWSFKLMRHYAVEGNKDMLSTRYGFKYNPGFLANGDFAHGMDGWIVAPAAEGAIRTDTIAGYGKESQGYWTSTKAGDTVCAMTRHADKPNRISQTVDGLEVGKAYCLQFVTADRKDVAEKNYNPRRYGIEVELEGVETLDGRGFVHIDQRQPGAAGNSDRVGKINLHRVVFRAKSPTQIIAFNDEKAVPGEELMINFIQLKPYFE